MPPIRIRFHILSSYLNPLSPRLFQQLPRSLPGPRDKHQYTFHVDRALRQRQPQKHIEVHVDTTLRSARGLFGFEYASRRPYRAVPWRQQRTFASGQRAVDTDRTKNDELVRPSLQVFHIEYSAVPSIPFKVHHRLSGECSTLLDVLSLDEEWIVRVLQGFCFSSRQPYR